MSVMSAKELVKELRNHSSANRFIYNDFIQAIRSEHRTHQQDILRMLFAVIEDVASDDYRFDGRNETSHKVAKKVVSGYQEEMYKELISHRDSKAQARKYADSGVFKMSNLPLV